MSEQPPVEQTAGAPAPGGDPEPSTQAAARAPAPPALTEDQTSGRLFVRWNAVTLALGLAALGGGVVAVRAGVGVSPPERSTPPRVEAKHPAPGPWDRGREERLVYEPDPAGGGAPGRAAGPWARLALVTRAERPGDAEAVRRGALWLAATFASAAGAEEAAGGGRRQVALRLDASDVTRLLEGTATEARPRGDAVALVRAGYAGLRRQRASGAHLPSAWSEASDLGAPGGAAQWLEEAVPLVLRAFDWTRPPALDPVVVVGGGPPGAPDGPWSTPTTGSSRRVRVEVEAAREEVEVPAGRFDCARVALVPAPEGEVADPSAPEREAPAPGADAHGAAGVRRYWVALDGDRPVVRFTDESGAWRLVSREESDPPAGP